MGSNEQPDDRYDKLSKATIALNLLDSTSTIYTEPFSAVAELVDNAYDAGAQCLSIDYVENDRTQRLEFVDDGDGMSPAEAMGIISFGHSTKNDTQIGRYGTGLKSGAFNLGNELIIVTKKNGLLTAMLISHAFHEDNGIAKQVLVPCPTFYDDPQNGYPADTQDMVKYNLEQRIIDQYAPFASGETLHDFFRRIPGESGTLVIISRLRRSALGELALSVTRDEYDFMVPGDNMPPYKVSLREYLRILYLKPTMRIILRKQEVHPKMISENWMGKYRSTVSTAAFKEAIQRNSEERQQYINKLNFEIERVKSLIADANTNGLTLSQFREAKHKNQTKLDSLNTLLKVTIEEEARVKKRNKDKNSGIQLSSYLKMGVEVEDRANNGIHFYINNRLILWGYKSKFFKNNDASIGISAYINLMSTTFRPTVNKETFEGQKDFAALVKKCNSDLAKYYTYFSTQWVHYILNESGIKMVYENDDDVPAIRRFWNEYGYKSAFSPTCVKTESLANEKLKQKKFKECGIWLSCTRCHQWDRSTDVTHDPNTYCCTRDRAVCPLRSADNDLEKFGTPNKNIEPFRKKLLKKPPTPTGPGASSPRQQQPTSSARNVSLKREIEEDDYSPELVPPSPINARSTNREQSLTSEPTPAHSVPSSFVESRRPRAESPSYAVEMSEAQDPFYPDSPREDEVDPENIEEIVEIEQKSRRINYTAYRPPAKKAPRMNATLISESDSEDSDDDQEGPSSRPVVRRSIRSTAKKQPTFDREKYLEGKINELLEALGAEKIPKNGTRDLDTRAIVNKAMEMHKSKVKRSARQVDEYNKCIKILLKYMQTVPNFPIKVPNGDETLHEKLVIVTKTIVDTKRRERKKAKLSLSQ